MNNDKKEIKIGFIGQGWIGKNYADNFEQRGYDIVRYGMEEEHKNNGHGTHRPYRAEAARRLRAGSP